MFCWLTEPPPPGLLTRTGEASFDAPNCAASDAAKEACPVFASWPSTWIAGPAASCEASCFVEALLPEVADEPTVFDCVTLPSEPGLHTRTGEATLPDEGFAAAAALGLAVPEHLQGTRERERALLGAGLLAGT